MTENETNLQNILRSNSPLNRNEAIDIEDDNDDFVKNTFSVSPILVKPAECKIEQEAKLYESQFKVIEDSNFLSAVPDDDKDSGMGMLDQTVFWPVIKGIHIRR